LIFNKKTTDNGKGNFIIGLVVSPQPKAANVGAAILERGGIAFARFSRLKYNLYLFHQIA
tara:strand:- start:268 stop:447 length:180 start_codon:yes stop_codon:yes gene_type:complete